MIIQGLVIPQSGCLVGCPGQNLPFFPCRLSRPLSARIESICYILNAGRSLKDHHILVGLWITVFECGHISLRVDLVVPLRFRVDHREHVRNSQLLCKDDGLDVIDV